MPYLRLIELGTHHATDVRDEVARLGRSPDCTVVPAGGGAQVGVVSALHAELRHGPGGWRLKDLGSRNGTFLNGRRLAAEALVKTSDVIGLGETGPRFSVAAVADVLEATIPEQPGLAAASRAAERHTPPEARAYGVTLLAATGRHYEARGVRIRLGRGRECEIQPVDPSDTIVSRIHAELTVGATGGLVVRDLDSTNGTFVNDERVVEPMPIRLGDRITLGQGGPVLIVEGLGTSPQLQAARRPARPGPRTLRAMISEAIAQAKRRLAVFVAMLILVLGAGVYGVYWLLSGEVQQTERERRTAGDEPSFGQQRSARPSCGPRWSAPKRRSRHSCRRASSVASPPRPRCSGCETSWPPPSSGRRRRRRSTASGGRSLLRSSRPRVSTPKCAPSEPRTSGPSRSKPRGLSVSSR